jgi:hypothetical protein
MALARKLFVNWHTRRRQASDVSGALDPVQTLKFFKYEQIPLEVVIVEPKTDNPLRYQRVDITPLSLKVLIHPTLDTAAAHVELSGVSVTKDESRNVFLGTLNLNTSAMNTYVASADKTPYFQVLLYDGTNWVPILQEVCDVVVGLAQQTTTAPDAARRYLTFEEAIGLFVPRVLSPGETITWRSPDGVNYRIFGVRDDGTPQDDTI